VITVAVSSQINANTPDTILRNLPNLVDLERFLTD